MEPWRWPEVDSSITFFTGDDPAEIGDGLSRVVSHPT
jgi:hypothetical protein